MRRLYALKRFIMIWLFTVMMVGAFAIAHAATPTYPSLVVKMVDGLTADQQTAIVARNGGVETAAIPPLRMHVISIPTGDPAAVLQNYQSDPQVERAEVNKTRKSEGLPSDTHYGVQWALSKIGWDSVFGSVAPTGSAKVAILDTGIDASHPDLHANVIDGTSVLDNTSGSSDANGHGTYLAGIVAAVTNNDLGIAGLGFSGVQIMPVTVLNASGIGQDSDIITGVIWAADHGADVILMGFSNADFSQNLQDAIDYAWEKGAVLVAATGNDGLSTPTFPAGARGVIGVSASNEDDTLAFGSNYGQATFLAAPGTNIYTTAPGEAYTYITGTSASSAMVAGTAALMKAVDNKLSNGVIVGRLAKSAAAVGTPGDPSNQTYFGNGRLDLAAALASTATESVQPSGAAPVGVGGPYIGPYTAASQHLTLVQVGSQNPAKILAGSAATYAISFTTHGSGTGERATLSVISGLPSGATAAFGLNPVAVTTTTTLTITTTPATPPGTYTFTVKAVEINSNENNSNSVTGTLIVDAAEKATPAFSNLAAATVSYGTASTTLGGKIAAGSSYPTGNVYITVNNVTVDSPIDASGNFSASFNTSTLGVAENGYAITYSFDGNSSFNPVTDTSKSLSITPAALTLTASDSSKIYGDTASLSGFTSAGLKNSDTVSGVALASEGAAATAATGTYAIIPSAAQGTGLGNYTITYNNGALTVTPAVLSITASNSSKTYGDTASLSGFTSVGLKNSDTISGVTLASEGAAATAATGSYSIIPSAAQGTGLGNYTITYNNGALTVNPAVLSITASNSSKTYGDTASLSGYTTVGLRNADTVTGVTLSSEGTAASAAKGSYPIVPSAAQGTGLGNNYTITYSTGTLTVKPAALTITASNDSKSYGDTASLSGFTTLGLRNADTVTGVTLSSEGTAASAAKGSYPIVPSAAQGTALGNNYTITYSNGTLTVKPAALTITASNDSKTYGDTASLSGFTTVGLRNADTVTGVTLSSEGTAASAAKGTYPVTPGGAQGTGLNNYAITYNDGTLTVNPAALSISASNDSKTYGDTAPLSGFTTFGLKNADTVTGVALASEGAAASAAIGSYSIIPSAAQGTGVGNYTITYSDGTLTVNPAALTISAPNGSKTYGDTASLSGFTTVGLKNSDTVSGVALASEGAAATAATGSYAIIPSAAQGTGVGNYTITYSNGTLVVKPAALTISAPNGSKTYGDTASLSGFTTVGLKNADTVTGVTLSSEGTAASAARGSYPIIPSAAQGTGLTNNYIVTYSNGTLTVNPAALTISAPNGSKTYGDTASLSGFATVGLKNADTVTGVTLSSQGAAASAAKGSYPIIPAGAQGTGLDNYSITYNSGTLTVNPAAINISANPTSKIYGDADPALSYTVSGLTNGDDRSVFSGALTRAAGSSVGSYAITQGTLSAGSNYVITYQMADFNITRRTVTPGFTAYDKSWDGNTTATIASRTLTGVVGTDAVTLQGGSATFDSADSGTGKTVTATGFTLTGSASGNYTLSATTATTTANISSQPKCNTLLINVPASNATGTYQVTWNIGSTAGVTYVLEAQNSSSGGWDEVYRGTGTSTPITVTGNGTYRYRVWSTKVGYLNSDYSATGTCAVNLACEKLLINVPATNSTGSYSVNWNIGAVPGVTYTLQGSFNGGAWSDLYTGTNTSAPVTAPSSGTYQYRVVASKTNYEPSTSATGTCAVTLKCAPVLLNIPATNTTGSFTAVWSIGSVSGVTYSLQVSTTTGWNTVYSGSSTSFNVTGLPTGSYTYRVMTTKTGYDAAYSDNKVIAVTR